MGRVYSHICFSLISRRLGRAPSAASMMIYILRSADAAIAPLYFAVIAVHHTILLCSAPLLAQQYWPRSEKVAEVGTSVSAELVALSR